MVQGERKIAISDVSNIPYPNDPDSERQSIGNNHFIKDYVGEGEDETEPFSDIFFPMLDYAADFVTIPRDDEETTAKPINDDGRGNFVGVFAMTFYWRDLIKDILPPQSNGVVVVFENACGQIFTYQVNGPETLYLGQGDLHEEEYDYLEKKSLLTKLNSFSLRDRAYTGLPVSEDGCQYTLHVYPSTYMEEQYTSNDPIIFTVAAIAIFAFTSLVFVIYDCMGKSELFSLIHETTKPCVEVNCISPDSIRYRTCPVERRQQKVMKSAVQTNAIVSSLFPSTVRDRLFRTDQDDEPQKRKAENTKGRLKTFLSDGKSVDGENFAAFARTQEEAAIASSSKPIADLFPHCTVLFSDIAGKCITGR